MIFKFNKGDSVEFAITMMGRLVGTRGIIMSEETNPWVQLAEEKEVMLKIHQTNLLPVNEKIKIKSFSIEDYSNDEILYEFDWFKVKIQKNKNSSLVFLKLFFEEEPFPTLKACYEVEDYITDEPIDFEKIILNFDKLASVLLEREIVAKNVVLKEREMKQLELDFKKGEVS